MKAVLVFIDGTICDRRTQPHLMNTPEFYGREAILGDLPVRGSVECLQELAQEYQIVYMGARPQSAATGAYAPLLEILASPFRATVISPLP